MSGISTHVLDTSAGRPAEGVAVVLDREEGELWRQLSSRRTDADGRVPDLLPGDELEPGRHRIRFEVGPYFGGRGMEAFYPYAEVVFTVRDADAHYHVPLLVSAFGYTTYRGS